MILDAHCHVWPDELAVRMVASRPAGMDAVGDGTLSGLLRTMDSAGIDRSCVLTVAIEGRHVAGANRFIGAVDRSRFIPVGTVHTDIGIDANLRALRDNGITAVKFHPNFQRMSLGDPQVIELLGVLAEHDVRILAHVGHGSNDAANERGAPHHVERVMRAVPKLRMVAFHFGGYHALDEAVDLVGLDRLLMETSWPPRLEVLGREKVRELIRQRGVDRVVFGSDWPMADPRREIEFLRSLELGDEALSGILGGNLRRFLGLVPEGPGSDGSSA